MINEIITEILNTVFAPFASFWHQVSDYWYLGEWYAVGLAVFLVCFFVGYFFPFQWIRAGLGVIVTWVIVALFTATKVFQHFKRRE